LLVAGGLEALTISAVEAEAGVYSSAIHYHFGSKEGLKAALVEQLLEETTLQAEQAVNALPRGGARLDEILRSFEMIGGRDVQLAFFETLGTQIRDEALHERVVKLYALGRELFTNVLGGDGDPAIAEALRPLAQVVFSFVDGMNVQLLVDPDTDDVAALAMMRDMAAAKIREITGVSLDANERRE
jgi:AcrR family transcriptional regulator